MIVRLVHKPTGKIYTLEAHQVSAHTDAGDTVAVTYEQAGFIVHSDRSQQDFDKVITLLALDKIETPKHGT